MRYEETLRFMAHRWHVLSLAAAVIAAVAVLAVPMPARALHPGAGDCPHVHDFVDESFSICTEKSTLKKCKRDGIEGKCRHNVIDSDNPFFPTRGTQCMCVREKDEVQALQIRRMFQATSAAFNFSGVMSAIGSTPACTQLATLLNDILLAKSGILGHGPVQFYDARLLDELDYVIKTYPTLDSYATSCSLTGLPTPSAVLSALTSIKLQLTTSFELRFQF